MMSTVSARRAITAAAIVLLAFAMPPLTCRDPREAAVPLEAAIPSATVVVPHATDTIARIPESIRLEHEAIHRELVFAMRNDDPVGAAARGLATLVEPHFVREEEIALPPLGLVASLAQGEARTGMRAVLPMTDSLRAELPKMLAEHAAIREATRQLERLAGGEGNVRVVRFARALALHARMEEELLYPMAVLVGELVRLRTADVAAR